VNSFFPWKRALRKKSLWFSCVVILGLGLVALFAPRLAPHDPYEWNFKQSLLPPAWVQDVEPYGSPDYPLGTDRSGRDVLSRMLYGTRTAFGLALGAVPLAGLLGTLVGLAAGYSGGKLDQVLHWLIDVVQSLPGILFMVIIILIMRWRMEPTWESGMLTLIVGFVAVSWAGLARLVRMQTLQLKGQPFVEAAVCLGASPLSILLRHMLPNVFHTVLAWVINNLPVVILLEAVLGYIGVGVTRAVDGGEFTTVSWGGVFFTGRSMMSRNPWLEILPALCILSLSVSFILIGDFVHEVTHPSEN
jgi:peptide/nickel transport system permease protein